MGRLFNVDRGLITFYADETDLDPQLDIILSVSLNGIVYRVEVTGRSQNPELTLSSEPPMPAGDIISGLLFGKSMSDLDSGQADLMEVRSRDILASYGSAVLGTRMARQIGVDVITIQQGEGSEDASRLMVGKYLSPKVKVSYKQVLSARSAFYVNLSYLLRSYLTVRTTVSQGAESGIELMLRKDY
jgi:translocation and assembly module TamB